MRINGKDVRYDGGYDVKYGVPEAPPPGRYFLIEVSPQDRDEYVLLSETPGRTNQSGEVVLSGWLGSTNNVSRHARGAVQVSARDGGGLRVRRIDAQALYDEVDKNHAL